MLSLLLVLKGTAKPSPELSYHFMFPPEMNERFHSSTASDHLHLTLRSAISAYRWNLKNKNIVNELKKICMLEDICFWSIQFSSVTQSCPTLWDPMNCSMPGLPVHHQLPEFTQTHVHQVGDAIQPSHPLSSPSPPAPNPSQDQSLFQ